MDAKTAEFFSIVQEIVAATSRTMPNRVFSTFKDFPWTPAQRQTLQTMLNEELAAMITNVLGSFDNVGGVLPEHHPGYLICLDEEPIVDIRSSDDDYASIWWEYLQTN